MMRFRWRIVWSVGVLVLLVLACAAMVTMLSVVLPGGLSALLAPPSTLRHGLGVLEPVQPHLPLAPAPSVGDGHSTSVAPGQADDDHLSLFHGHSLSCSPWSPPGLGRSADRRGFRRLGSRCPGFRTGFL